MTALTLRDIVAKELGSSGAHLDPAAKKDKPRRTEWSKRWPGYGVRHYVSGRQVHVVQARMDGRTRTVTIGDSRFVSKAQ
ncbi:hypothetical protein N8940_02195, partial [Sphingomonadaceae bacterium]|nr:hypothetical protein [Sphingomonadaceae bacterium]